MTLDDAAQAYRNAVAISAAKAKDYKACAKTLSDAQAQYTALTEQCAAAEQAVKDAAQALEDAASADPSKA